MARPHPDHTRFIGIEGPHYSYDGSCAIPRCANTAAHMHHAWSRTNIRKKGGGGWDWVQDTQTGDKIRNLIPLCFTHHADIHEARARIYYDPFIRGFAFKKLVQVQDGVPDDAPLKHGDWSVAKNALLPDHHATPTPPDVPVVVVGEQRPETSVAPVGPPLGGGAADGETVAPHIHLEPGKKCPTCARRVSYPKTDASPTDIKQLNLGKGPGDTVERLRERLDDFADSAGITEKKLPRLKALDVLLDLGSAVNADTLRAMVDEKEWAA